MGDYSGLLRVHIERPMVILLSLEAPETRHLQLSNSMTNEGKRLQAVVVDAWMTSTPARSLLRVHGLASGTGFMQTSRFCTLGNCR